MLRPKLGRIWADSSSVARRDPGDTKYVTGWLSEIPTYQVLNFLQWKNDSIIQALAERGVLEWGGDVTYKKGAAAWDETNNRMYVALLDNPDKTKAPSTNSAQWTGSALQLSRSAYDATVKRIDDHIADVTGNPHRLTPGRLGTYTVSQIDTLVAQYRAEVQTHASRKDNPHKVTATQIGAVPVEGGTYTGDVTMGTGQLFLSADKTRLIKSDSTGVYMKNDAGAVGIDAAGKGFVKIGSTPASEIITQDTFADNKQTVEPSYAPPKELFYMPLIRDINIYVGGGTADSAVTPQYDQYGRFAFPQQLEKTVQLSAPPMVGASDVTVAADIAWISSYRQTAKSIYSVGVGGTGRARMYITCNGTVGAYGDTQAVTSGSMDDGKTHRFVIRRTATRVALFVDGVLFNEITTTNAAIDSYPNILESLANSAPQELVPVSICNVRVFAGALTNNQISVL